MMHPRYDAFISYSHAVDDRLAPALQAALQRFAKPWRQRRALRIFRDQSSLAAAPELWPVIQAALDDSAHFVLLASPEAAQSRWVRREVAYWRDTQPLGTLLIALTGGELIWDEAANDFDWARSDALPPELKGAFPSEPLWVDLRWAHDTEQFSMKHPRFLDAIGDLAAPLHGRPKEDLLGEDVRQHKRTVRLAAGTMATLALLLIASMVGAAIAMEQRSQAAAAGHLALARQLAAQAGSDRTGGLDTRLLLAVEANRLNPGATDARGSLLDLLASNPHVEAFLPGQRQRIDAIRFRPDGSAFATAGADGVSLWDAGSREVLAGPVAAPMGEEAPLPLAFSPDGRIVATSLREGVVSLLDGDTLAEIGVLEPEEPSALISLEFSPDGTTLAAVGVKSTINRESVDAVTVWDVAGRQRLDTMDIAANDLVFGTDNSSLFTVGPTGGIVRLNWRKGTAVASDSVGYFILTVALSPDGKTLIFDGAEGAIAIRDAETLENLGDFPAPRLAGPGNAPLIRDIAYSPDGTTVVATGDDGMIYRWNTKTRVLAGEPLGALGSPARVLTFSPDGERLVSGGTNGAVVFWDLDLQPRLGRKLNTPSEVVYSVAIDGAGRVAFGDTNGRIHFWEPGGDAMSPESIAASQAPIEALAFSRNGRLLAAGDSSGTISIWDAQTRQELVPPIAGHALDPPVYAVLFVRDDQVLATVGGSDGTIRYWDTATGEPIGQGSATVANHDGSSLALSADGRTIAEATNLGIRLVDANTFAQIGESIVGPASGGTVAVVAYSPDGRILVGGGEGGIILVDAQTDAQTAELSLPQGGLIFAAAIGLDDATLASGANDGSVRLWDIPSRQVIGELSRWHQDWIRWLAYTPDGRSLISNDNYGDLVIWDVRVETWIAEACAIAGRDLSAEEWAQYLGATPYQPTCSAFTVPGQREDVAAPAATPRATGSIVAERPRL